MNTHFDTLVAAAGVGAAAAMTLPAPADELLVPQQFPSIQAAVDAAQEDDEVIVADGTWQAFDLVNKTITVRSASDDPALCTVQSLNVAVHFTAAANALVRGISITTNGASRGVQVDFPSIAVLENCRIHDNALGGVVSEAERLVMRDCVVDNNSNDEDGGGIRALLGDLTLENCHIADNSVNFLGVETRGGGLFMELESAAVLIAGCTFSGNTADRGAGLYAPGMPGQGQPVTITGSAFEGNTANIQAGGLYVYAMTEVINTRIVGNQAVNTGGMLVTGNTSSLVNCLIAGNDATGLTGGVRVVGGVTATLINCTLANNTADAGGGGAGAPSGSTIIARNCVAGSNQPVSFAGTGALDVTWSIVQDGFGGEGNLTVNPQFVAPGAGDYRVSAGSPAIDSGHTPLYDGPLADLDGKGRGLDDPGVLDTGVAEAGVTIDRGAYEFQAGSAGPTCPGDTNGDGLVNVSDLIELVLNWGVCP